jgi:serine/threonine protein kinase
MTLSPGTRFGRYEIRSPLGQQGVRELYLAQDPAAERTIALRILRRGFNRHIILKHRFLDEARVPSALSHRNIALTVEAGLEDDVAFVASEFSGGTTLRQMMDQNRLEPREALHIAVQICSALVAAHRAGLIHRKLNPESVLVGPRNAVSVIDFGLAVFSETHNLGADAPTIYDSGDNQLQAQDPYNSPEQARGVIGDVRSDIWGLGVILYEMLSGRLPFDGKTNQPANSTIIADEPLLISDHDAKVPTEAIQILKKALKNNREERYQTASELLFDLRRLWRRMEVRDVVSHIGTSGIDKAL